MKKIILSVLIAAFVMTACENQNTFTLTGTFANNDQDGKVVYLRDLNLIQGSSSLVDTVKVEKGKFIFKGMTNDTCPVLYVFLNDSEMLATFIAEKGKIELNFDSELKPTLKGTAMNVQYQHFLSEANDIKNKVDTVQKLQKSIEEKEATAVGKQFSDVKGFNLAGKEVKLSDYAGKGKVVLVDFWASWCGPCRQAMPDLVATYQKYKNKGLEIVGISLDNNKDAWAKATDNLKITWPQFSNLKGWDEDCAATYGVNGIPHTILIDKDGKITARGLGEDELNIKLEELLGK